MKRDNKIRCKCGQIVTLNTMIGHVAMPWCSAADSYKKVVRSAALIRKRVGHKRPYISPATEESLTVADWFGRVVKEEILLESLTWDRPRKMGVSRPSTLRAVSISRIGSGNPSVKKRLSSITFSENDIKKEVLELYQIFLKDESLPFSYIEKALSVKFKNYACLYTSRNGGHLKNGGSQKWKHDLFAEYLGVTPEKLKDIKRKRRGKMISIGQRASDFFLTMASEHGSRMTSQWRVTKPHRRLYEMVLRYDPAAILEYRIQINNRWKSFDVYSPKLNILIEMHGRIWHDLSSSTPGVKHICYKNIENDKIKKDFANSKGFGYEVFWDDEEANWPERLKNIYEIKS